MDNDRLRKIFRIVFFFSLLLIFFSDIARATGEIAFVRAPEEIPQGDDVTIVISASARETDIDRALAIEFPESWKFKRAWKVEAGSDHSQKIVRDNEISSLFSKDLGREVLGLADNSDAYDPDAEGIAYFIVFSTSTLAGISECENLTIKAALVERTDPDASIALDPKTKHPLPRIMDWRMTFPERYDFSFNEITMKRLMATVRMDRIPKIGRALVISSLSLKGSQGSAHAVLDTRKDILRDYFQQPFSIQFWFRTTVADENVLLFRSGDGNQIHIDIGPLGQPRLMESKPSPKSIIASRPMANDGVWHNLVLSEDSLHKLRLFLDAQPSNVVDAPARLFENITNIEIGDSTSSNKDFSIDELRLFSTAYRDPTEFQRYITTSTRDTAHQAFAVFHFDDYGLTAHSSIPLYERNAGELAREEGPQPIFFVLDSATSITDVTSPVQIDPFMLNAELLTPNRVGISWKTTSELGVKQYRIERRIGLSEQFEKVLSIDAKHGVKTPKRGQPIVSRATYNAHEDLPKLNGNIDLYYRIASVGFSEKDPIIYSFPVKLEYGAGLDVFVEQNQPNPFNPTTEIAFRITESEMVRLSVFDIIGREVAVLANDKLDAGRHSYSLDATNWPPGIYFYKVRTARTTVTRKMFLVK